jgi:4-amino-4-deoxy-L-arabinose transferase-like glycosyltransferase
VSSDEAAISLNLMHRSYTGLFHQLDVNQAAPPGFLVLQKLAIDLFGPTPYALRLLPLLAGVVSMILFYPFAVRIAGVRAALIGTALFATTAGLVTYSATIKPYSVDVAVALVLYVLYLRVSERFDNRRLVTLAIAGAVAVSLSYPATFVLTGTGAALLISAARSSRRALAKVGLTIAPWLVIWAVAFSLTLSSVSHLQRSLVGTQPGLGGAPDLRLLQTYAGVVRFLIGVPEIGHGARGALTIFGFILAVIGFVIVARSRGLIAVALVVPAAVALLASYANLYALFPRTFLFLAPTLITLTAAGIATLLFPRGRVFALAGACAGLVVVTASWYGVADQLHSTTRPDAVRALRFLASNARPGDAVYLHQSSQLDFRYYLECGCFGSDRLESKARTLWQVRGPLKGDSPLRSFPPRLYAGHAKGRVPRDYAADLAPVRGRPRVWVFVNDPRGGDQAALREYVGHVGQRRVGYPSSLAGATAAVTLYDLR